MPYITWKELMMTAVCDKCQFIDERTKYNCRHCTRNPYHIKSGTIKDRKKEAHQP
jgi:hypothetical protein